MSHASKIVLRITLERIPVKTETEIADEQAGFRQGRQTRPNHESQNTDSGTEHQQAQVTSLRYADDIVLLATWEIELQELMDRLDRVSRKYSLHINVDKTKVMARDGTS